jgi:hypothetical protein
MNNIIKQLENNEYSIDDYNKIIDLCNKKIILMKEKEINDSFKKIVKEIKINNEELKCFFDIIYNTLKINSNDYLKSITISFDYNEYSIDLCIYSEDDDYIFMYEKIHVLNKLTHSYEVYYENSDKILFKKIDFKSVSIKELNEFIKSLFEYAANIINF